MDLPSPSLFPPKEPEEAPSPVGASSFYWHLFRPVLRAQSTQGVMPSRSNSAYSRWDQSVSEVKPMRTLLFGTAVIAGVVWIGLAPANTAPQSMPGIGNANIEAAAIKNVGYRRRYYRRYGYPVPYAYYPPAYG